MEQERERLRERDRDKHRDSPKMKASPRSPSSRISRDMEDEARQRRSPKGKQPIRDDSRY